MDDCEEKKLMDKVMRDPNNEFVGKERVCDKDVEKELWKFNEEPKIVIGESGKASFDGNEKSMKGNPAKEEILPGIGEAAAHSMSP